MHSYFRDSTLVSWMTKFASIKTKRQISRVILVDILQETFSSNFSSKYLEKALVETYNSFPPTKEYESARFFTACALSKLGKNEKLLDFATSPGMVDTSMYLISGAVLHETEMIGKEKDMYRKFKKRLQNFRNSIKKETKGGFLMRKNK